VEEEPRDGEKTDVGAHHIDIAVREVDKLQHAVHHGVADGDQGVNTACLDTVDQLLEENLQRFGQA
jgi:hypothetical protein